MKAYEDLSILVQRGKAPDVKAAVEELLAAGNPASEILDNGLLAGMSVIGEKFKNNEVFVPEVLIAARAMNTGLEVLKPALAENTGTSKGKAVLGTVKGDLHDIGKNLVKIMMEGRGIEVIDLGVDVSPERFVDEAVKNGAKIIACSALLTTTMNTMKDVVALAEQRGLRSDIKIMVGGAPVTQAFCESIGADCYTADAASASEAALEILAG